MDHEMSTTTLELAGVILKYATEVDEIDQALVELIKNTDTGAGQHNHLQNSSQADNPSGGIRR